MTIMSDYPAGMDMNLMMAAQQDDFFKVTMVTGLIGTGISAIKKICPCNIQRLFQL